VHFIVFQTICFFYDNKVKPVLFRAQAKSTSSINGSHFPGDASLPVPCTNKLVLVALLQVQAPSTEDLADILCCMI
jgi:hypothetical protein